MMTGNHVRIPVYAAAHFLVDFACAFLMFSRVSAAADFLHLQLLYNFFAFAMQMPLGLLADRLNRNAAFASAGCLLTALAYAFASPLAAAVSAGIGNGMFHVGGGLEVINHSGGKSGPLGVFVSPGAFGIYLGAALGRGQALNALIVVLALILAAAAMLMTRRMRACGIAVGNPPLSLPKPSRGGMGVVCCLFMVVALRSLVGMTLSFPWREGGAWGLPLICAVVLGKALGGYVADSMGILKAAIASLGLCALAFLFGGYPIAGLIALMLFNMTMPMTLYLLSGLFPGSRGFAFGLLTFALFLGFLPVYMGAPPLFSGGGGYALAALITLALLYPGLRRAAA